VPAHGPRGPAGARLLGRHDAAPLDRAGADARPRRPLPGRAERGARPPDAPPALGPRPRVQRRREDDRGDDALHGGSRRARPEPPGMSTFLALLSRDLHVARRNLGTLLIQTLLQPMLLTFVFGRIMTTSGFLPDAYKSLLLPGIIALSMILSGIQSVAMPVV